MSITSQMIFHLLARTFEIECWALSEVNIPVSTPRLYRGQELQSGHLYILDDLTDFNTVKGVKNNAFLIQSSPRMLPDAFRFSDVAFVQPGTNKLDLFDEVNGIFNMLMNWDLELKDACYGGAPVCEVMELGRQVINVPLSLYDGTGGEFSSRRSCGGRAYELFLDDGCRSRAEDRNVYTYPDGAEEVKNLYANIVLSGETVAVLVADVQRLHIHKGLELLFRRLAGYVTAACISEGRGITHTRNEEMRQALGKILFGRHTRITPELSNPLKRAGWSEDHCYRVVVFKEIRRSGSSVDFSYIQHVLETDWPDTCVLTSGPRFVWVINRTLSFPSSSSLPHDYLPHFIREHMLRAGISCKGQSFTGLKTLCEQAGTALSIGQRKHPQQWLFAFDDYRLDYVLDKYCNEFPAEQTVHQGLQTLIAYDSENGTDYVETLKCYIDNRFNASTSAEQLFVHRSTFLRRIERIEEISGIKFKDADELLYIMISLKICESLISDKQKDNVPEHRR